MSVSNHSCDSTMRVRTTYRLEMREPDSTLDCSCDYKMRAGNDILAEGGEGG
jgi:hypothetical protein